MNYPLSLPQKQIIWMEHYAGGPVSVICGSVLRPGICDATNLQNAANELLRLNDALRITLSITDGEIIQYISPFSKRDIPVLHFAQKEELHRYCSEYAKEPLNLYGSLCELKVFLLPGYHGIIAKQHHIVSDAWTMSLVGTQFFRLLDGLPFEVFSYVDYLNKEHLLLDSNRYSADKAFFLDTYENHVILSSGSHEHHGSFSCTRKTFILDRVLSQQIIDYTRRSHTSPFLVFLAGIAVHLYRTKTVSEPFYIGIPVLNRSGHREKNTMGMFVNIVPCLVNLSDNLSFYECLQHFKTQSLALFRHQKYNYTTFLSDLHRANKISGRLFDVLFSYQNAVAEGGGNTESTWYSNGRQLERLQIHVEDRDELGVFRIHYDYLQDFFSPSDIDCLHRCLTSLIADGITNDAILISSLSYLTAKEKESFLYRHDIPLPYSSLYALVEDNTVGRIIEGDKEYNLSDLKRDAEIIDAAIHGYKRIIGVLCDRSYLELAAIYGIVRGGNAYLPISPDYPPERIQLMLEQSGCKTILAQAKYQSLIEGSLCIEDILSAPAPSVIPPVTSEPDDVLYVIFTSGSTGTPKGAAVSNRAAVNRILWMCHKYFTHDTVVMLKTPYTFDVSVWEIFGFALGGFTLYVLPPEDHYRQDRVIENIRKGHVTDLHFVPSVFRYFLDTLRKDGEPLPSLKNLFLSGEALSASLVNESPVPVHNLYGPTECAVDVTYYDCAKKESDPVPIGMPIDNCQVYVLDRFLQPFPVGVVGQICIGGIPVGQGYINDAAKTQAVFVPNPFGSGKLYLTGDLGYWREDGQLIYVGRNDQQVKINGQRVELGEIEAALSVLVPTCAVFYDNNRLVAYYIGEERVDLRKQLLHSLPRHMVPHSFIHVDELPLTSSGKVDRQALRSAPHLNSAAVAAPATQAEQLLIECVKEVLSLPSVSIDDNFYELGGDSLSSLFVITQLQDHGYELSISDFLKSDTLSDAARKMRAVVATDHRVTSGVTKLPPVIRAYLYEKPNDPASFAQTCVIPIDAEQSAVRRALNKVISQHEMLGANFSEDGFSIGNAAYRFRSETGSITYEPVSFDLEHGPLVDAVLYPGRLKLTIHHFVIDAVSWTIIIDELRSSLRYRDLPQEIASYREFAQTPRPERVPFLSDSYLPLFTAGNTISPEERYSFSADPVPNEVLLTALGLAANELVGGKAGICVETHGRTDVRYSRTVGWFTAFYPFSTESIEETKASISALSNENEDFLSMFDHIPEGTSIIYNYIPIPDDVVLGPLPLFPGKLNVICIQQQDNVLIEIGISSGHHPMGIAEQLGLAFQRHIESLRAVAPSDHSSFATVDAYELTPAQVGMYNNWSAYYLKYVIRVEKPLDIDRLKNALHLLAEKHPVLKSKFVEQGNGVIKQLILKESDPYLQGTGIRHGDSNSLFRVTVDGDRFIITTHHIILDGWSLSILARDLKMFYDNPQAEAEPTPSFGLYSSWLKRKPGEVGYWKDMLTECGVSSDLSHTGNAVGRSHAIVDRLISVDGIVAFARIHRVTINTVFETAFAMLLLQENPSAIYGKMLSGRNAPISGIQDIVGPFVNMVPVFVRVGSPLLSQVHEQSIMANEYGYVSLAELYSQTDLKRINILFVFENYPSTAAIDLVEYRDENEFDLTITVRKTDTGYLIRASYSPEKYTSAVIDRALSDFESNLRQLLHGDEEVTSLMSENNYVTPIGATETAICRQFEEVIGIERVSRFDNFFDLGGTSLNVMELLCKTPLDVLSPSAFMNNPTPAGLAEALSKLSDKSNIIGLYTPEHATLAFVLFPYGGGDAAAYTALVAEFRRRAVPVALYFVPWGCDYDAVATELRLFRIPLRFYSHCAGAVIALKLLDRLDCVEKYFAGANIPPEDTRNIWTTVPDETILSALHQAGMPVMPEKQNDIMLQQFRENTKEYFEYLEAKEKKTPTDVSLIVSRYDLFTQSYPDAKPLWEKIVSAVNRIQFIDSPTHYFQSTNAASLADILLEV